MKKIIIFFLLIIPMTYLFADEQSDELLKEVRKTYNDHENLCIDFSQVFLWKLTGEKLEMSGKICVQNGEKFRIETPDNMVVNDGKALYTLSYANQQVIINHVQEGGGDHPFLKDFIEKYIRDYHAEWVEEGNNVAHLRLSAKSADEFVTSVELWIDEKSDLIRKVVQTDANDNETTYIVDSVNTERKLTADDFKIPDMEKYELIDLR